MLPFSLKEPDENNLVKEECIHSQFGEWGVLSIAVGRSQQQEAVVGVLCSYCNGSPSLVTYVPARPCVLKGPQPLETVPSAGDQIFKHMSLWRMFHAETTVDGQAPDTSNIRKSLSSPNWGQGGETARGSSCHFKSQYSGLGITLTPGVRWGNNSF